MRIQSSTDEIRRSANAVEFYFIEPGIGANADDIAMRLIRLSCVKEVHITEGACGFVVKAKQRNAGELAAKISKQMKIQIATSHCRYTKALHTNSRN